MRPCATEGLGEEKSLPTDFLLVSLLCPDLAKGKKKSPFIFFPSAVRQKENLPEGVVLLPA